MDLRHLETFVHIAKLKSFTKAAEQLCRTQPTISKQISDLETYFGVKLFDRTKRVVTLTKAGELVLQYANEFLTLKDELQNAVDAYKGIRSGNLMIGASTIPGIYIMPEIISIYNGKYSGVNIRLTISDTRDIVMKTENGEIDIGFVGARIDKTHVLYKKMIDDTIVIVAPKEYPGRMNLERFCQCPLITREEGSGTRDAFEVAMKRANIDIKTDLKHIAELSDTEAVKQAVRHGLGVAYISKIAIKSEILAGNMKILHVDGFRDIKRTIYVVVKKGKTLSPQGEAFIEIINKWRRHEKN